MLTHSVTTLARESSAAPVTDSGWFEQAVSDALPGLLATARRLTRHNNDAEDLVAETVARAWTHRDSLEDRTRSRQWLCRIMTNTFISGLRTSEARHRTVSIDDGPGDSFSLFERLHQPFLLWWGDDEQRFLDALLREDIERAVDSLPDPYRLAIVMCELNGMSYQEIADSLDVPIGTVRSRLARARALLQKSLWNHGVDAGLVRRGDREPPQ